MKENIEELIDLMEQLITKSRAISCKLPRCRDKLSNFKYKEIKLLEKKFGKLKVTVRNELEDVHFIFG